MWLIQEIKEVSTAALKHLYQFDIAPDQILVNDTKPEFEGDYTVVLFSFVKQVKLAPDALGQQLGAYLTEQHPQLFTGFQVIKGFLNLTVADAYWTSFIGQSTKIESFGRSEKSGKKVMVEYSSPNTNKPLHLGHLRNNFLGWSIAAILEETGYDVTKTCIVNDRGIHICKSMVAWLRDGSGATPTSTGKKGDHLVGDFYVLYNTLFKQEVEELVKNGMSKEDAEKNAPILLEAQQMLVDWEAGKPEVIELWQKMNSWVYDGFQKTYDRIGSDFNKTYYESNTYLLGKDLVETGLSKKVFYQKDDSSVWIDLTADGLDEKIVRRRDGTSVYMTQDIGLAVQKFEEFGCEESIYVVGDEQNYHFKVLKLICEKLQLPGAKGIYHLSYGMVELPTGKMKSREGTVVDADDLLDEMTAIARQKTEELGKVKDFQPNELEELYHTLGLGALKFFLLRVDPQKKMIFNPEESIDFHGFTGPFVQYTHARICSVLRRLGDKVQSSEFRATEKWLPLERSLAKKIENYTLLLTEAAQEHNPSKLAIYLFELAKVFNSFYAELSIAQAESEEKQLLRLNLSKLTAQILERGLHLLGIQAPQRM